jgi:translation initiation factor IF-2
MFYQTSEEETHMVQTVEYDTPDKDKNYVSRPPVVTVMGHVDHGKTTLLDTVRKANVAGDEAGSITQHITSYQITHNDKKITFVDTPGHEAFTAMRARGSQLADFVVLMVSAVEGPKPQTVEVIERAKMAKVRVFVALNKTDLPEADPERVKNEVAKYDLVPEEWGGETPFISLSAKTGENISELLDSILAHAELANLQGEVNCAGQALVIESHLDRNLGVVTSILVVKDKIQVRDIVRCGSYVGKVKRLESSTGKNLEEAHIGEPVVLIGLPEIAEVGQPIIVYDNQRQAQTDADLEREKQRRRRVSYIGNISQHKKDKKEVNLVLKADVTGSLEALKESLVKIPQEHAQISIKQEGVGEVTENDVEFAKTTDSTILAFHTNVNSKAKKLVEKEHVNLIASDVIYQLLEWVEEEILNHAKPQVSIKVLGEAKVLAVFSSPKPSLQIVGGEVTSGKIFDNKTIRIKRDGEEIDKMDINELQRNKSKATEVNISQQFGISLVGRTKLQEGDILECIEENVVRPKK